MSLAPANICALVDCASGICVPVRYPTPAAVDKSSFNPNPGIDTSISDFQGEGVGQDSSSSTTQAKSAHHRAVSDGGVMYVSCVHWVVRSLGRAVRSLGRVSLLLLLTSESTLYHVCRVTESNLLA